MTMGLFSAVKEQSDLHKCLTSQADVGNYKWFEEYTYSEITGAHFYQKELKALAKKYKSTAAPIEMVREFDNKADPRAIAYYCNGVKIGHVPTANLDWWHRLFEYAGDAKVRLVGTATFSLWEAENEILAKPKMQVLRKIPKPPTP